MSLGEAAPKGATAEEISQSIPGWITMEWKSKGARALVSRAWPAIRLHYEGNEVVWRTSGTKILGAVDGAAGLLELPLRRGLSEPWLVVFGHEGPEDTPVLLTFTRKVLSIHKIDDGYEIDLAGPGAMHVMPLEGIRRHASGSADAKTQTAWIIAARAWVAPLLSFPMTASEEAHIVGDRIHLEACFSHELLSDDYGAGPLVLAPFPPGLALAAKAGYPVEVPDALVGDGDVLSIPTFYGPLWYTRGAGYSYSIPAAVGIDGLPLPPRSREAQTEPIRAELHRIIGRIGEPVMDYIDANVGHVKFLAEAMPELDEHERDKARAFAEKTFARVFETLRSAEEPSTGQTWWTVGKTWRAYYAESDPPWAKESERFDSEFYNGQALSALERAARIDESFATGHFEGAKRLYVYDQIFWDWPTGSVMTQATGDGSNIDGVQFAWEGMIAMARMARRAGDGALERDAAYRAARQQAALFSMWQQAAWVKQWDYAVGHAKGRLAPAEISTEGPINAYIEEFGALVLDFDFFWECTNFLFYANRPLFEFYRRYGLVERIRKIEYTIMPELHPSWLDGNAINRHGENGVKYYGASYTATHLAARAALFHHDPEELFLAYKATEGTEASRAWYSMQQPTLAGPLMLLLLEAWSARRGDDSPPLIA